MDSAERIQDAINELENVRGHPDLSLCSIIALLYAHRRCETLGECNLSELGPG